MNFNSNVFKSVIGSSFFKLGSSLISFFAVPLLLGALGTKEYGVWVTLTAMIAWLNLFDFGSGYSLKNKITESLVQEDTSQLQVIISGTIQFYFLTTVILFFVFCVCLYYINVFKQHLLLSVILYLPVILAFPFTLGHFMLQGLKKFNLFNFFLFIQSLTWLLIVFLFSRGIIRLSMLELGFIYGVLYIIVNFCLFYISLQSLHFNYKALFNFSHFKNSKESLLVGGHFFLLQISSLMLFSAGNVITYDNLQASAVSQYDTVNKIFIIGMTFFNIIISVFWAEFSQAKALKDVNKLMLLRKRLFLLALFFSTCTCVIPFFLPMIIVFWTKGMIHVKLEQLLPFVFLAIVQYFSYAGAVVLNAFENLKGQIILSAFAALLIIPVANYFFQCGFGIGSVPLASAVLILPTLFYVIQKSKSNIKSLKVEL